MRITSQKSLIMLPKTVKLSSVAILAQVGKFVQAHRWLADDGPQENGWEVEAGGSVG